MKKINWIVIDGKADIKADLIRYIPEKVETEAGYRYVTVHSNQEFENGTIEFSVKLNHGRGRCQVVLSSTMGVSDLNIGVNVLGSLYGIIRWDTQQRKWEFINAAGNPDTLNTSQELRIKITVFGSEIVLYVNEIEILRSTVNVRKSQLKLALQSEKEILVKNFKVTTIKPKAFIVMQFSDEYNQLYEEVIKPVCESKGIVCERADEYYTTNMIIDDIIKSIKESSLIIADITPDNPNVFYEVGYSHAIDKPTILLCDKKRSKLPFDLTSFRTLFYENSIAGKTQVEQRLRKYLDNLF